MKTGLDGRFELHCHSMHSKRIKITWESVSRPRDIVRTAKKLGLSGIALTDHNVTKGWKEAKKEAKKQGMIFIPGQEVESRQGHVLALGISETVPNNRHLFETIDNIHGQGGLAIAPHPFDIKGDGLRNGMRYADAVEIFNSLNIDRLSNRLARIKARRLGMPVVAGSDAHTLDMIGSSAVVADAYDLDSLLRRIKQGDVRLETRYLTTKMITDWTTMRFIKSYNEMLDYIDDNYNPLKANLARFMLNGFMTTKNRETFWNTVTRFSLGVAEIYSIALFLAYYK
jgi:predicted metal-dependent phosphoesterase TrpH